MNVLARTNQESKRISELKKYDILDSCPESDYEDIAHLASVICQAPIALITFIDENRQWLKSSIGIDLSEMDRAHSFCTHAIQNPKEMMIVEDARKDSRFQNNPLVAGAPNLVFYAGIPLTNKQNFALGAICVLDTKPRTLTRQQTMALKLFSLQIMHLLELRRINHEHKLLQAQLTAGANRGATVYSATENIRLSLRHLLEDDSLSQEWYSGENNSGVSHCKEAGKQMELKIKVLIEKLLSHYKIVDTASG